MVVVSQAPGFGRRRFQGITSVQSSCEEALELSSGLVALPERLGHGQELRAHLLHLQPAAGPQLLRPRSAEASSGGAAGRGADGGARGSSTATCCGGARSAGNGAPGAGQRARRRGHCGERPARRARRVTGQREARGEELGRLGRRRGDRSRGSRLLRSPTTAQALGKWRPNAAEAQVRSAGAGRRLGRGPASASTRRVRQSGEVLLAVGNSNRRRRRRGCGGWQGLHQRLPTEQAAVQAPDLGGIVPAPRGKPS
mmetsp:Transcript_163590/g.519778  ORF Transcript_163590/g.519778 Transcript_163590/m.519778 type:complete len:255 (+) Transcript_163590:2264-3028(+)